MGPWDNNLLLLAIKEELLKRGYMVVASTMISRDALTIFNNSRYLGTMLFGDNISMVNVIYNTHLGQVDLNLPNFIDWILQQLNEGDHASD